MMKTIALTVALGLSSASVAQDTFQYDGRIQAKRQVRLTIENSVYQCARSRAYGIIIRGTRSRAVIHHDPRVAGCQNLLTQSQWFSAGEKRPLFERIVDRAIDDILRTGGP